MIDTLLNATREKMRKALDVVQTDLSSIRSGRATPALVENMIISCYGGTQKMKLMEMATITAADARALVIAPYDVSVIGEIEKGIQEHNVGLTPVIDGEIIRITIPPLSQERRQEYIKLVHVKLEGGRIMIRQLRQEAMKDVKRLQDDKLISEDEEKVGEKKIQEITDDFTGQVDSLGKKKEEELLQI